MESQELRVFLEVAKYQSMSKAAEILGYVQPNVTGRIKKLEEELGCLLFERHSRGVTLTRDGERLRKESERIIKELDGLVKKFVIDDGIKKPFVIGTTQSIAGYLLPQVVIDLRRKSMSREIRIITDHQEFMQERLDTKAIDLLITNRRNFFERARCIGNYREELVLIGPSQCKGIDDMKAIPIIVNSLKSCPYRQTLMEWMVEEGEGDRIDSKVEVDTLESMIQTVALGGGIALLPKGAVANRKDITTVYVRGLQRTTLSIWTQEGEGSSVERQKIIEECLEKIAQILGE